MRYIGMIQRGEEFRFPFEACQPIAIGRDGGRQYLERDFPLQARVARAVDLAHSACPQLGEDLVDTNSRTDHLVVLRTIYQAAANEISEGDRHEVAGRSSCAATWSAVESIIARKSSGGTTSARRTAESPHRHRTSGSPSARVSSRLARLRTSQSLCRARPGSLS